MQESELKGLEERIVSRVKAIIETLFLSRPPPAPGPFLPELFSREEAAKRLGLSLATIKRLIESGDLRATRARKRVLISASELDRFANPEPTTPAPRPKKGGNPHAEARKVIQALRKKH